MYAPSRVIRRKLKVADANTWQIIEGFKCYHLAKGYIVENCSKGSHTKLWSRDGPVKALALEQKSRKRRESVKIILGESGHLRCVILTPISQ